MESLCTVTLHFVGLPILSRRCVWYHQFCILATFCITYSALESHLEIRHLSKRMWLECHIHSSLTKSHALGFANFARCYTNQMQLRSSKKSLNSGFFTFVLCLSRGKNTLKFQGWIQLFVTRHLELYSVKTHHSIRGCILYYNYFRYLHKTKSIVFTIFSAIKLCGSNFTLDLQNNICHS